MVRLSTLLPIVLSAAVLTGLNALKPLHIDDAALEISSRQYLKNPLDPYGFAMFWYDHPEPANDILMPPVLPAYIALVRRLLGENPFVWKLALFPWALLLAWAIDGLLRRFVDGPRFSLLLLILISPGLLPNFNVWLDLPALALGLSGLRIFLSAADRRSLTGAAFAGLLAGFAMQTKYTAFTIPPALLLYAACSRRWREGAVAVCVALPMFASWEILTHYLYGSSHFVAALPTGSRGSLLEKLRVLPFLLTYLGGLCPAVLALGLAGLGAGWRTLTALAVAIIAGVVVIASFDIHFVSNLDTQPSEIQFAELGCLLLGSGLVVVGAVTVWLLARRDSLGFGPSGSPVAPGQRSDTLFLILWLGLEIMAYPSLTPFAAARRVLGVSIVLTLLLARWTLPVLRVTGRCHLLPIIAGGGMMLAVGYEAFDLLGARAYQMGAEESASWVHSQGQGQGWFVGHWGFQYYAERAGLKMLVPNYRPRPGMPEPSHLHRGDWLVVPDDTLAKQDVRLDPDRFELIETHNFGPNLPLRVTPCFYAGRAPLEHREGPLLVVKIYRVKLDGVAEP